MRSLCLTPCFMFGGVSWRFPAIWKIIFFSFVGPDARASCGSVIIRPWLLHENWWSLRRGKIIPDDCAAVVLATHWMLERTLRSQICKETVCISLGSSSLSLVCQWIVVCQWPAFKDICARFVTVGSSTPVNYFRYVMSCWILQGGQYLCRWVKCITDCPKYLPYFTSRPTTLDPSSHPGT